MSEDVWKVTALDGEAFMAKYSPKERQLLERDSVDAMSTRLRPFYPVLFGEERFFVVSDSDGKVIGLANFIRGNDEFELSYVSVDSAYRHRGIATALVKTAGQYLLEQGQAMFRVSDYTGDGRRYLKKVIERELSRARSSQSTSLGM